MSRSYSPTRIPWILSCVDACFCYQQLLPKLPNRAQIVGYGAGILFSIGTSLSSYLVLLLLPPPPLLLPPLHPYRLVDLYWRRCFFYYETHSWRHDHWTHSIWRLGTRHHIHPVPHYRKFNRQRNPHCHRWRVFGTTCGSQGPCFCIHWDHSRTGCTKWCCGNQDSVFLLD